MKFEYDLVVIGGGSAGLTAAGMAALLGAKTVLVEAERPGGDCTWVGCVPSKTLLRAARAAHEVRQAGRFGIGVGQPEISFGRVMEHVRAVREQVYRDADAPEHFVKLGVEVVRGRACFTDAHTVAVREASGTERRLSSRYLVIATGSRPKVPSFAVPCLTNESVFDLSERPERLVVMGAGPIGMEMAQAFQRLGSAVTVVAPTKRVLPRDDEEHARVLEGCLREEGVQFVLGQSVRSLERASDGLRAELDGGQTIACDAALAAVGRAANVESLALDQAGVTVEERGITVDRHCRTNQRHIFAVGDVTGQYQFTHMAEHMAKVAVTNAILRWPQAMDEGHVVWSTFTDPEVATLGKTASALAKEGVAHSIYRLPLRKVDRAVTEGAEAGEVKVMADRRGRILGVSIVCAQAGEMVGEYALAMRHGLTLGQVSQTIHPYPTFALGNRQVADQQSWKQLDSPWLGVLGRLLGYRGVRRGSAALS